MAFARRALPFRRGFRRGAARRAFPRRTFHRASVPRPMRTYRPQSSLFLMKATIVRDLRSVVADAGNIYLGDVAYQTELPLNGACAFALTDLPADLVACYINVFDQYKLNGVKVMWVPPTNTASINSVSASGGTPSIHSYEYYTQGTMIVKQDWADSELESASSLANSNFKKLWPMNRGAQSWFLRPKPMLAANYQLSGGSVNAIEAATVSSNRMYQSAWKSPASIAVNHHGFKWYADEAAVRINTTTNEASAGQLWFTYYIAWRFNSNNIEPAAIAERILRQTPNSNIAQCIRFAQEHMGKDGEYVDITPPSPARSVPSLARLDINSPNVRAGRRHR